VSYPTSRRYARTLAEAFPDERACAVERYRAPQWHRPAGVLLAVAIGVALAFVIAS
jgi:hypothetical protein